MWKLNLAQEFRVYKFTTKFVEDILLWACRNPNLQTNNDILNSNMNRELSILANGRSRNFKKHMLDLSKCGQIRDVYHAFLWFKRKFRKILSGETRPPRLLSDKTRTEIKGAFDYFYGTLLDNQLFWDTYNPGGNYKTRNEIREEQGRGRVCPYCDQTYINTPITSNMDHFLPKSVFPFLSIYWQNIIVSCTGCNNHLVKADNWFIPILHPYFDPIEDVLYFSFDEDKRIININACNKIAGVNRSKARGKNLIALLKYKLLYRDCWSLVEEEQETLQREIQNFYHENKGTLNRRNIYMIFVNGVENRTVHLKERAGRLPFTKLKIDFGKKYARDGDSELLDWLLKEQNKMLQM